MDSIQTVVVGAGVIGIAVARKLARAGHEVLVLEAEERIAQHTSSRNSGVIHAGIYYAPNSWRARLCVQGKAMLYDYCADRHVAHENTQKLIVGVTPQHIARMPDLIERAQANGVQDLVELSAQDAHLMEPELVCQGAILSPSTGIVDAPAFIQSLLGEAEAEGAFVALGAPLERVVPKDDRFEILIGDADWTRLHCKNLINAAGLGAWDVARRIDGLPADHIPNQYFAKGSWFSMSGRAPFERLIYPMPDDASLGVHYTRDFGGGFRFGPDLHYLDPAQVDYTLEGDRAKDFENSVRRWWPTLPIDALQPDSCGIRPRVSRTSHADSDFVFSGPRDHGFAGLVQLFGMESPGLTASLAVAKVVGDLVLQTPA